MGANEINDAKFLPDKESIEERCERGDGDEPGSIVACIAAIVSCCLSAG